MDLVRSLICSGLDLSLPVIALVSTRYLLVEQQFHFPLHLLLAQLIVTLALLQWGNGQNIRAFWHDSESWMSMTGRWAPPQLKTIRSIVATLLLALSLPLCAQSILHLANFAVIPLFMTLASLTEYATSSSIAQNDSNFRILCTLAPAVVAFSIISFDDYRITINGYVFGLAGIFLCFLAIHLLRHDECRQIKQAPATISGQLVALPVSLAISAAVTAYWALSKERDFGMESLLRVKAYALLLNLMVVPGLLVLRFHAKPSWACKLPVSSHSAYIEGLVFAGLASLVNNMLGAPGYLTILQVVAFIIATTIAVLQSLHCRGLNDKAMCPGENQLSLVEGNDDCGSNSGRFEVLQYTAMPILGWKDNQSDEDAHGRFAEIIDSSASYQAQYSSLWRWRSHGSVAICLAVFVWTALLFTNQNLFAAAPAQRRQPSLDLEYKPSKDLEIVVSMYQEDLARVAATFDSLKALFQSKGRSVETTFYVKDWSADLDNMRLQLNATVVGMRPNIGREGETYLHHILTQYDHLAAHTLFIQAHVHNLRDITRRIDTYFQHNTGALSLGFAGNTCECNSCVDRWGWADGEVISEIYGKVYHEPCSTALLSYKGQFIASARRLRGIDRSVFEDLYSALTAQDSWAHREPYLDGRPDSMNAPYLGYALERAWSILLQCSEPDIALKCPTLLAGTRSGGDTTDCQCLDDMD